MMLTNEKVLEISKSFLDTDDTYEVVMTSHGYTLLDGKDRQREWDQAAMSVLTVEQGVTVRGHHNLGGIVGIQKRFGDF